MKKWTTRFWTGRTGIERSLIVALTVAVLGLLAIANAWRRQLTPWATEWGNWAEWAGAIATALGFGVAVFTLNRNGKAEEKRRREFQEMEASRVVVTVDYNVGKSNPPSSRVYDVCIHNAASSPVKRAMFYMDRDALPFSPAENELLPPWPYLDFGTVPAGQKVTRSLYFNGKFGVPYKPLFEQQLNFDTELQRTICYWFYDVYDSMWLHENGSLKQITDRATLDTSPHIWEESGWRDDVR